MEGGQMTTLVAKRNTTIPTKTAKIFTTCSENHKCVLIKVDRLGTTFLGTVLLGIPPAPRGVPQIEVIFDIDANGILKVVANEKLSGQMQKKIIANGMDNLLMENSSLAEIQRK
ncbi:hypothetical protein niasHT_011435 [Heterodera trifolii]|uniref:Heat shock protein 70 n=1 Tax=Heterodera trifolii TaxID=157864 RepID=A0ABD2L0Y3_9BILA